MLRKILNIANVGRFEGCKWLCGTQFESLTLIYGENSRGKSTFCDILRSCQKNSPDYILGRRRLGSKNDCEVELRTDGGNIIFKNKAWNTPMPQLAIFDSTFVHENIFAGDRIDHDHKKNLYRIVVGEIGVALAKKVDDLDAASREAAKEVSAKRAVLEARLPKGTDSKTFLKIPVDESIASKIEVASAELKTAEAAAAKATLIQTKTNLQEIDVPVTLDVVGGLLVESLPNIAADAEKKVREHIANHTLQASETWLSKGLSFQKDAECPYCGQNTAGIDIVASYRAFFDETYLSLKKRLATTEEQVAANYSDKTALKVQKALAEHSSLRDFWNQLGVGVNISFPDLSNFSSVLGDVREAATALLRVKINNPLQTFEISPELNAALKALLDLREAVEAYNISVKALNAEVVAFKKKQGGTDISKLKAALAALKLAELRRNPDVAASADALVAAEKKKADFDDQKKIAKAELDKYDNTVLTTHEKRINELLQMFGAGFRIGEAGRSDIGGKPSFNYKLCINDVAVEVGNEQTPLSAPSFRNTLSAGDRSTLALALFISQLESDPQMKDRVVVFDDPFTSQDRSRRTATQSIISRIAKQVKQVLVLSHDPHFLRAVWDGHKGGSKIQCFQFFRMANGTTTGTWDIERETAGEYVKKHRVLWDFVHNATGTPRTVAQTIRPILEEYLRLKLPQSFADNEWLGDFIGKIRNAADTDPVAAAKGILPKIELINEYSKRYHHSSNPHADTEIIDDTELMTFAKATLDVVGGV